MNDNSGGALKRLLLTLLGLVFIGTTGFLMLGEGSLWRSFYKTVIILLSHVAHGMSDPIGDQLLSIFLILGSFFIVANLVRFAAEYFLGGAYKEHRRDKKMKEHISKMKDHYIVCGFGRVGRQVAEDLYHANVDFVVLDRDMKEINHALSHGFNALPGDPTDEGHLNGAGIARAKSLISCLGEDADNLFLTLTARALNPDLYIVARANDEENSAKFERAGANRVAIPYQIGGYHMATMALRPAVLDFLDVIVDSRHDELEVEEIEITLASPLNGKTIAEALSRDQAGTTVLAINHKDGSSKVNPNGKEMMRQGDKLILMGNRKQLDQVSELVS